MRTKLVLCALLLAAGCKIEAGTPDNTMATATATTTATAPTATTTDTSAPPATATATATTPPTATGTATTPPTPTATATATATGTATGSSPPSGTPDASVANGPPCSPRECGPAPMMPNRQCSNGTTAGPGPCTRKSDGKCGWTITTCPP